MRRQPGTLVELHHADDVWRREAGHLDVDLGLRVHGPHTSALHPLDGAVAADAIRARVELVPTAVAAALDEQASLASRLPERLRQRIAVRLGGAISHGPARRSPRRT